MRALSHIFGTDIHPTVRIRVLIAFTAFVLMIAVTIASQLQFLGKPLQVRELAGRNVSMDKLADVFLGMDQISLMGHYLNIALMNGVIFLGALLLLLAVREGGKK